MQLCTCMHRESFISTVPSLDDTDSSELSEACSCCRGEKGGEGRGGERGGGGKRGGGVREKFSNHSLTTTALVRSKGKWVSVGRLADPCFYDGCPLLMLAVLKF